VTPETALQLTIAVTLLATIGLIASEIYTNLRRERDKDAARTAQDVPPGGAGTAYADLLPPSESTGTRR
jgi:hypothetical protein